MWPVNMVARVTAGFRWPPEMLAVIKTAYRHYVSALHQLVGTSKENVEYAYPSLPNSFRCPCTMAVNM